MYNKVEKYIYANWEKTFRYKTEDEGRRLGLPYPYTVAGVAEKFQDMYYWGTFFTNVGLIFSGYVKQAQNNVDNMLWLVEKYGFMLNANGTWALTRSQPPFLSLMIREIYKVTLDKQWLSKAYNTLKENQITYTSYKDNKIEGTITVNQDQLIFTSIPYDKHWKVTIDGKETQPIVLLNSLMGIECEPGTHTIKLEYKNNLTIPVLISITTFVGLITKIILDKRKQKKSEN